MTPQKHYRNVKVQIIKKIKLKSTKRICKLSVLLWFGHLTYHQTSIEPGWSAQNKLERHEVNVQSRKFPDITSNTTTLKKGYFLCIEKLFCCTQNAWIHEWKGSKVPAVTQRGLHWIIIIINGCNKLNLKLFILTWNELS